MHCFWQFCWPLQSANCSIVSKQWIFAIQCIQEFVVHINSMQNCLIIILLYIIFVHTSNWQTTCIKQITIIYNPYYIYSKNCHCHSVQYNKHRICWLKKYICKSSELRVSHGNNDYFKLRKYMAASTIKIIKLNQTRPGLILVFIKSFQLFIRERGVIISSQVW